MIYTCNLSSKYRTGTNPFTGQTMKFPLDDGLTVEEHTSMTKQLVEMQASEVDPDGYCKIRCIDGREFNISVGPIDADIPFVACDVEINVLTPDVITSLFRLARSANMAITRQCCGPPRVASKVCLWYNDPRRVK